MIISMNNKEIIQHIIIAIIMTLMMIFLEDDNILIDIQSRYCFGKNKNRV